MVLIGLRAANTKGEPPGGTPAEITGVVISDGVNDSTRLGAFNDEEKTFPG